MNTKFSLLFLLFFLGFNNLCYSQCSSEQTTTIFSLTGVIEQFTVPNGVTSITMTVIGADGGNSINNGGTGATATATFTVTSGEVLDIVTGLPGNSSPIIGAGGGGGSGVRRNATSDVLIVAGGGGGGGQDEGGGGGDSFSPIINPLFLGTFGNGSFMSGSLDSPILGGYGVGGGRNSLLFPDGSSVGGGGGGFYVGGFGLTNNGGQGGFSYINSNNVSSSPIVLGEQGVGNLSNGSVVFCYTQPEAPIPTMSQWGLMIFGLLTMNLGLVFLRKKEEILA